MTFSTSEWLAIIGILVAVIFGVLAILKKEASSKNNIKINQKSAPLSKSKQRQNVRINLDE